QGVAQAHRVDLPAPVRRFDIGVADKVGAFAVLIVGIVVLVLDGKGHVVAEADVIDAALLQGGQVLAGHVHLPALALPVGKDIGRIEPFGVDVHVIEAALHGPFGHHDVLGLAGGGIDGGHGDHTADLVGGVDLVAGLDRQGAGHQLVVGGLVHQALVV